MPNKLPDYLIFQDKEKYGHLQIRKLKGNNEVGVEVEKENYDFPFHTSVEFFIDRNAVIRMIIALMQHFNIKFEDIRKK